MGRKERRKGTPSRMKAALSWVRRLDKGKDEEKRCGRQRRKTRVRGGTKNTFTTQRRHPLRGMPTALKHGRAGLSPSMLLLFKKYNVCKKNNGLFVLCYMASLCILFTKYLRH